MQQEEWTKGVWWKFDGYELFTQTTEEIEQSYIRPTSTSRVQGYDPWLNYRHAAVDPRDPDVKRLRYTPYQGLVDLIEDIDSRPRSKRASLEMDAESETRLLQWCSQNGLLGILPHVSRQLTLAPVWKPLVFSGHQVEGIVVPNIERYSRTATGWSQGASFHLFGSGIPPVTQQEFQPGDVVGSDYLPVEFAPPSAIVQSGLLNIELRQEPLSTIGRSFPSVPIWEQEKYQYPMPLSPDFWRMYAEPLDDFLEAARALATAIRAMSKTNAERSTERAEGAKILTSLIAPVMVSVYLDEEGEPRQQLASPSLLSSYAFMAMLDLTRGTVYECKNRKCGRIYISDAWQSLYCSKRCKYAEQKREQRSTKDPAEPPEVKGRKVTKRLKRR